MIKETLREFITNKIKKHNWPYEKQKIIWRKGTLKKRRGPVLDFHLILENRLNNIFIACFRIEKNEMESFKKCFLNRISFKYKIEAFKSFFPSLSKIKNNRGKSVLQLLKNFNDLRNDVAHHPYEEKRCQYGDFGNIVESKAFKIFKDDFTFLESQLTEAEIAVYDYYESYL